MLSNRKQPQDPPPEVKAKETDLVRQVRTYRLITPLYGGGAKTQQPDEVTVVRASEIRGLLRFWWRATRGGQFDGSLEKMRRAEEAIWGSAAEEDKGPSPISLAVQVINRGHEIRQVTVHTKRGEKQVKIGDPSSPYGYVAFPLRDNNGSVWGGVEFELHITLHTATVKVDDREFNLQEEIDAALWAWETFGGVGARTRRGFGALQLTKVNGKPVAEPTVEEIRKSIHKGLSKDGYVKRSQWPDGVPHLHPAMMWVITARRNDADRAWKDLFGALKEFRQARYPDEEDRPYGRSKWPEPDAIRRLTGTHSPGHAPQHPVTNKFPRGRLGLPIIFQFKDEDDDDPPKTILEGSEHERFASRLILRPLACQKGAVGLAFVLEGPNDPPGGYVLKEQSNAQILYRPEAELAEDEARQIEPLNGEPDVLKAFMKTLGWKEKEE